MDITVQSIQQGMYAKLDNYDDKLTGLISEISHHGEETRFYIEIESLTTIPETEKQMFTCQIYEINDHLYLQDLRPALDSLYSINTEALRHGVNMIKGFFSSNKYRHYVKTHSKRAKLIAEKKVLNRKISKIDKKLD